MRDYSQLIEQYQPLSAGPSYQSVFQKTGKEDQSLLWSDHAKSLGVGSSSLVSGLGWLAKQAGAESVGSFIQQLGDSAAEYWADRYSDYAKEALQERLTDDDLNKKDWDKVKLMLTQSLPATATGMKLGSMMANGFKLIPKMSSTIANAAGFSMGEGVVAAGSSGAQVENKINKMSHQELMDYPEYAFTYAETQDKAKTKELIKRTLAGDAAAETFITTSILSAPFGALTGNILDKVRRTGGSLASASKGAVNEATQEFFQSGTEQIAQNRALGKVDHDVSFWDDVIESAVSGAASGGLMGGGLGVFGGGRNAANEEDAAAEGAANEEQPALGHDERLASPSPGPEKQDRQLPAPPPKLEPPPLEGEILSEERNSAFDEIDETGIIEGEIIQDRLAGPSSETTTPLDRGSLERPQELEQPTPKRRSLGLLETVREGMAEAEAQGGDSLAQAQAGSVGLLEGLARTRQSANRATFTDYDTGTPLPEARTVPALPSPSSAGDQELTELPETPAEVGSSSPTLTQELEELKRRQGARNLPSTSEPLKLSDAPLEAQRTTPEVSEPALIESAPIPEPQTEHTAAERAPVPTEQPQLQQMGSPTRGAEQNTAPGRTVLLSASGQPFSTFGSAKLSGQTKQRAGNIQSFEVVEHENGYGIAIDNSEQAPPTRKQAKDKKRARAISDVMLAAANKRYVFMDLGGVGNAAKLAQDTNTPELANYTHAIDSDAVQHILKQHGDQAEEEKRNQIAVTPEDIKKIPDVLENYDRVSYAEKDKKLQVDTVTYSKAYNGTTIVIEAVRKPRKKLFLKTMWKLPTTQAATTKAVGGPQTSETHEGEPPQEPIIPPQSGQAKPGRFKTRRLAAVFAKGQQRAGKLGDYTIELRDGEFSVVPRDSLPTQNAPEAKQSKPQADAPKAKAKPKPQAGKPKPENDSDTRYRTEQNRSTAGVSKAAAENVISRVARNWKAYAGKIHVAEREADLPEAIRLRITKDKVQGKVRGIFHGGQIHIVAGNLTSTAEVERVLLHEIKGHGGLRALFGDSLKTELNRVFAAMGGELGFTKFADKHGIDLAAYRQLAKGLPREEKIFLMMDELLAHMAEIRRPKLVETFNALVTKIKALLRQLGFSHLVTLNDQELFHLLSRGEKALSSSKAHSMEDVGELFSLDRNSYNVARMFDRMAQKASAFRAPKELKSKDLKTLVEKAFSRSGRTVSVGIETLGDAIQTVTVFEQTGENKESIIEVELNKFTAREYYATINSNRSGGGALVYQALFAWAHNNDKVLIPDPVGLSPINYLRRLEAAISSALRFGTTKHIQIGKENLVGLLEGEAYHFQDELSLDHRLPKGALDNSSGVDEEGLRRLEASDEKLEEWLSEWKSGGSREAYIKNLNLMLKASAWLVYKRMPELRGYTLEITNRKALREKALPDTLPPGSKENAGFGDTILRDANGKPTRLAEVAVRFEAGIGSSAITRALLVGRRLDKGAAADKLTNLPRPEDSPLFDLVFKGLEIDSEGDSITDDIADRILEGEIPQRLLYSLSAGGSSRASIERALNARSNYVGERLKDLVTDNKFFKTAKEQSLGLLTLQQLSEVAEKIVPQIKQYVDIVRDMLTLRNTMAEEAATHIKNWQSWAAENKPENDALVNLMHDATIEEVDPSTGSYISQLSNIRKRIALIEKERRKALSLGKSAKQLDRQLEQLKLSEQREDGRIASWKNLHKQYEALSQEAKDIFLDTKKAYEDHRIRYVNNIADRLDSISPGSNKFFTQLMRLEHENARLAPYFPLVRFGKFFADVKAPDGERVFLMFETEREQQRTIKNLEKDNFKIEKVGKTLDKRHDDAVSMNYLEKVVSEMESSDLSAKQRGEVEDILYQQYLEFMPDRSIRRQFIHRKKTAGYSSDAIRGFADRMMKSSYQIARMQYADRLNEVMKDMEVDAKEAGGNKKAAFYNEMIKRHQWVMNPTSSAIAQKLTSIGFVFMLGVSPAAAAVNLTQVPVVAGPVLGAKYGVTKSFNALVAASTQFSIRNGSIKDKLTSEAERAAYQSWVDSGLLDATQAQDLAGIAEQGGYNYSARGYKVMQGVSFLFHKAELFNREVTAIAAYRLAVQKGLDHAAAVKEARELTWKAHFDYGNLNRARFMQADFMKVATQFKQYSQNITYYLLRNLHQSFKGATKEERRAAQIQLGGTLAMTGLIGGINALPLSALYVVIEAVMGDDDDPIDGRATVYAGLSEMLGKDIARHIIYGAGGAGISGRVSLDGLWIRDASRDLEGQDAWAFYAGQAMGPVLGGIAGSYFEGMRKLGMGEYQRAFENFVPKFARDVSKAIRFWTEGATTLKGDILKDKDEFAGYQLILQAMGISDDQLSRQYEENNFIKTYESRVIHRRRRLVLRYYQAWKNGDESERLKVVRDVAQFNQKWPEIRLDGKALQRSIRTRERYRNEATRGIVTNKKIQRRLEKYDFS